MKSIFFDIDSQRDFLYPAGALYVPGAEHIAPTIGWLNRYAAARGFPVISTVDAHSENDIEFRCWPPHCVAGTHGQQKAEPTLLEKRVVVPNRDPCVADSWRAGDGSQHGFVFRFTRDSCIAAAARTPWAR